MIPTACSQHISTKNNGVPSGTAPLRISMRVGPGWMAIGLHLCVLVWAIPHSQNQDIEWIVYLPFCTHTTILVYARSSHYKFDGVWKLTRRSRTPHRIIVHNQRTLQDMAEPYFNKEPWCPGTAPLYISIGFISTKSLGVFRVWINRVKALIGCSAMH